VGACYVDPLYPVEAEGWDPQYYDGYLVYYDEGGRPFYYMNGGAVWIPEGSPYYARFHGYWAAHPYAYRNWHARYGARFHSYRVGPGIHGSFHGGGRGGARR
jgi:hypothetical protein